MDIYRVGINDVFLDENNPRESVQVRAHLLKLSLAKMGYVLPIYVNADNMILSGHQRWKASRDIGHEYLPIQYIEVDSSKQAGLNMLFNRVTNDFSAFDTGANAAQKIDINELIGMSKDFSDMEGYDWPVFDVQISSIRGLGRNQAGSYDKKAVRMADQVRRLGVEIPIVCSENGTVLNGLHRLYCAKEGGIKKWPIVTIADDFIDFATNMLNYLSMNYSVGGDFEDMLRSYAFRRPQNNRGMLPKAFRFWANGERTLPDKDSYSRNYMINFRELHGSCLDFGGGLCKSAPYLRSKGIEAWDFEPYRINNEYSKSLPDPDFSRKKVVEFLEHVANPDVKFDSIFLASVMNSIPFPKDRMCVLSICHALCGFHTIVYGTCRDISDFEYEYAGIRNAGYFVFDSEPGVRLGDGLDRPKIQKFHSQKEADGMFKNFWLKRDFWPGGNVFYFRCSSPKKVNTKVLSQALEFEFDLPYHDGTTMGLVGEAKEAFGYRLKVSID